MKNRELDRLIAEHIFGWTDFWSNGDCLIGYPPSEQHFGVGYDERQDVPNYSTDLLHAWMVVEKLPFPEVSFQISKAYKEYDPETDKWGTPGWEVIFGLYGERVWADTPQLAICLAALKSAGVELKE